jgi:hypothetical protein
MLLDDRRMKVREIAETIGILKERVRYILHEEVDMKKLCARRVPCLLDQKRTRVLTKIKLILCVDLLLWMRLGFTVTHQNPNSSQNSGQKPVVQRKKRQQSVPSAGKVMASVFWDAEGILFIDYLEKGKTIGGEYYSNFLTRPDKKNS